MPVQPSEVYEAELATGRFKRPTHEAHRNLPLPPRTAGSDAPSSTGPSRPATSGSYLFNRLPRPWEQVADRRRRMGGKWGGGGWAWDRFLPVHLSRPERRLANAEGVWKRWDGRKRDAFLRRAENPRAQGHRELL